MSSLTRMLSILELFSKEHRTLTADAIAENLGLTRTTCYRYVGELTAAGLLISNSGLYGLGPRIIQLDYRIREADPLLIAGREPLADLVGRVGGTGLLVAYFNGQVVNVHEERGKAPFSLTYSRGRTIPTFRSASSKVILAHLREAKLKRLWKDRKNDPDVATIGTDWGSFREALHRLKKQGYAVSHGELDDDVHGVAAPIFYADGTVAGSVTLVFSEAEFRMFREESLGEQVMAMARRIGERIPGAQLS